MNPTSRVGARGGEKQKKKANSAIGDFFEVLRGGGLEKMMSFVLEKEVIVGGGKKTY